MENKKGFGKGVLWGFVVAVIGISLTLILCCCLCFLILVVLGEESTVSSDYSYSSSSSSSENSCQSELCLEKRITSEEIKDFSSDVAKWSETNSINGINKIADIYISEDSTIKVEFNSSADIIADYPNILNPSVLKEVMIYTDSFYPEYIMQEIDHIQVGSDGLYSYTAYTIQNTIPCNKVTLYVDLADFLQQVTYGPEDYKQTLLHEAAHIESTINDQILNCDGTEWTELGACETNLPIINSSDKGQPWERICWSEDAALYSFYQRFWKNGKTYPFVSEYAKVNYEEDFAESYVAYVNEEYESEKTLFFDEFISLKESAKYFRTRLSWRLVTNE